MASTYTIAAPGAAFVTNKCMLGLYNGVGSGLVLRVYRAWALNNQTQAVTGVQQLISFSRLSTGSGGISVLPVKHDSQSASLPAQVVCATNMDYTVHARLRRFAWSSDEPLSSDANGIDEVETIPAFTMFWDYSVAYNSTTVEPLVLREGYGAAILLDTLSSGTGVGSADFFIEFTSGAS